MKEEIKVTRSSGNVFKDLGLENSDELAARSDMITAISKIIKERGLKQADVAEIVGLTQADVSRLTHGIVNRFSTDRIMQVLTRLGHDVEIVIKPKPARRAAGRVSVKAA
ncbi:MAG TPA: helix-turn-helix transcriptional regulator [Dongiaceae bacterium]|nr:helix-turn-helix transcriptional regulator [Dongiaceae bacterium]